MDFYLARNKDGSLFLYKGKPIRNNIYWYLRNNLTGSITNFIKLDSKLFPDVKWENEEPTKVELIINDK